MEITKNNFGVLLPDIQRAIVECDFVCLDMEFTGIPHDKGSLFDTVSLRYSKLQTEIDRFSICQLGLALFKSDASNNQYFVDAWNIYLQPAHCGTLGSSFVCQTSALDFLCRNNFDFNKAFHAGVPYLNVSQVAQNRKKLLSNAALLSEVDLDKVEAWRREVVNWLSSARADDKTREASFVVNSGESGLRKRLFQLVLQKAFPQLDVVSEDADRISLTKANGEVQQKRSYEDRLSEMVDGIVLDLKGCSRIFDLIIQRQAPIVGHNAFLDLLFFFSKLHDRLPYAYAEFKSLAHKLLPRIYDTRAIALGQKRLLEQRGLKSLSLSQLYDFLFRNDAGRFLVLRQPAVVPKDSCRRYASADFLHEAGFDAFLCGSVFVRLSHIYQSIEAPPSASTPKNFVANGHVSSCQQLSPFPALAAYENKIAIARAPIPFVVLSGSDPESRRPALLYVRSAKWFALIDEADLAQQLSAFGTVDVALSPSKRTALVATSTQNGARLILKRFRAKNSAYRVDVFNPLFHTSVGFGCCCIVSVSFTLLGVYFLKLRFFK